jgi:hypothetical protein
MSRKEKQDSEAFLAGKRLAAISKATATGDGSNALPGPVVKANNGECSLHGVAEGADESIEIEPGMRFSFAAFGRET